MSYDWAAAAKRILDKIGDRPTRREIARLEVELRAAYEQGRADMREDIQKLLDVPSRASLHVGR